MKKRFMIPAAIAALMGVGAYFGHATATPADTSDLLLDNAEALAGGEIINPNDSYGYKLVDCMDGDRIIGAHCQIWSPIEICHRSQAWGECYY